MANFLIICMFYRGRMLVEDLELKIKTSKDNGIIPLFVNATGGTTVLGAYDPVDAIADVCQKYKIWMHVDVSNQRSQLRP